MDSGSLEPTVNILGSHLTNGVLRLPFGPNCLMATVGADPRHPTLAR